MFRGAELARLLTSLVLLAVLGMLIGKSQDARNFEWLCGKQAAAGPIDPANSVHGRPAEDVGHSGSSSSSAEKPPQGVATREKSSPGGSTNAAHPAADRAPAPPRAHGKPLDLPPPPTGPTDLDEEERDAASEEFQALTDRSEEMRPEEMNAYWRLFSWVQNQSLAGLRKRAVKDAVLNDFMQSPDDFRGRLVALELNVRQVIRYPATKNRLGIKNVYQVAGFTTQSQAWPYLGLTADLPAGMPVGSSVEEQATFYGYFLKLQGYQPGGAKPNDRPLAAPLLIGRLVWHSAAVAQAEGESFSRIFWWGITGAALVVAGGVWLIVWLVGGPSAARNRTLQPRPVVPMDQWLRTAAAGGLEIDGADSDPADSCATEGDGEPGEWFGGNGSSSGR